MNAKQEAVEQLLALKQQRKEIEGLIESQLSRITTLMAVGETVDIDDTEYELKDNFSERNVVFRPAAVFRFDIAEVK